MLIMLVALAAGACKINEPLPKGTVPQVPSSFQSQADSSASIGAIPWKSFFSDSLLVNLIQTTLQSNPDLRIAMQRVEMSRATARVGRNLWLPSLSLVTSAGQRKFGEYTMDGIGNFDTNFSENLPDDKRVPEHLPDYYIGLQSAWEIDLWGRLRGMKKAAVARFLAFEKGRQLVTTTLVAEVAKLYYELLALDTELQVINRNIQLQQTALSLMEAQKAAGRATELAVKQSAAQLYNTRSLEADIRQRIVTVENQINVLAGRYPQQVERDAVPILERELPTQLQAGMPSQMLLRRPDIQQAELNLRAAEADVTVARAAFFPQLIISSSWGAQSFRLSNLLNTPGAIAYSVFGGLTTPIFNRRMIRADYQRTQAAQLETLYEYQKTILIGFQEVATNLQRIENLQTSASFKQQETEVLREGVATANDLYLVGLASYLEVITAQRSALEAELQLAETRKEQFFAVVDLYKALGGGWQ